MIELLVAIAIVGILAALSLLNMNEIKDRAKISVARQEMASILTLFASAQIQNNSSLRAITGSGCSDCSCRGAGDLRFSSGGCLTRWQSALTRINAAAQMAGGGDLFLRDPWGSPYLLDENEDEGACRTDTFRSAGPDGIYGGADQITVTVPRNKTCS